MTSALSQVLLTTRFPRALMKCLSHEAGVMTSGLHALPSVRFPRVSMKGVYVTRRVS
ncbi:hypothetical protein SAMN05443572_104206 [Myxococcus fulvus]|uniref:Uncharacterized protein n=1 Tax=Myxococcus fulvus TaxID=33 RepID=A0A511SZ50_MYXFU|nr:hypothetical protein [Myxococcus fulvus]GEN07169.1 hypothetical protein MFU01_22060 [Myxococcus fulvus]SET98611.1 hypothetical protein SAMN05443572_104206 [Myxococcus fulvus]